MLVLWMYGLVKMKTQTTRPFPKCRLLFTQKLPDSFSCLFIPIGLSKNRLGVPVISGICLAGRKCCLYFVMIIENLSFQSWSERSYDR